MAVEYELRDGVALIHLNRPHRLNAVVPELTEGLVGALERATAESARVAVLAGRGRAFCSGTTSRSNCPHRTCRGCTGGWTGSRTSPGASARSPAR